MNSLFAFFLSVALCLPTCAILSYNVVKDIQLNRNCTGFLKRAADANTVELAKTELSKSLKYLEETGTTSGYTSVLYQTPDEDIGFWYGNLKRSYEELSKVTPETTQLERSNLLLKLRQTLLDGGEEGEHITVPSGLNVYPYNGLVAFFWFLSLVLGFCGVVVFRAFVLED